MDRIDVRGLTPARLREILGDDLALDLPQRVEERLAVDVFVTDIEGDGYTLRVAGRSVLIVQQTNWFRQAFSIAHELGHLAADSLCDGTLQDEGVAESAANRFAADLLMPATQLRSMDWQRMDLSVLAERLWHWGVSTHALQVRLRSLRIPSGDHIAAALAGRTIPLLRRHWQMPPGPDLITRRMTRSTERRVPADLITRLESAAAEGRAPVGSLAYALGVPEGHLDIDAHPLADPAADLDLLEGLI